MRHCDRRRPTLLLLRKVSEIIAREAARHVVD